MARKHIGDLIQTTKFHEEVTTDVLYRNDILDTQIVVYDISEKIVRRKSDKVKFNSTNIMLLMSHLEDADEIKYICWVSGEVVISQLEKIRNEFPTKEGVLMTLTKPDNYYRFE